jgi:hypothetical protein
VRNAFGQYGFTAHGLGTELDDVVLRQSLAAQDDRTSRLLRFRPDQALVRPGVRSLLVEVKSERGRYPNFAIEVASHQAASEWDSGRRHVAYAFVDLGTRLIWCCWAADLPPPVEIRVPLRWDFEASWQRLNQEWPGVRLVPEPYRPGPYRSGTPYFLLRKTSSCLQALDVFVRAELLSSPAVPHFLTACI